MKFLCIECDEAMNLKKTSGPDEGSLAVIFSCPNCQKEIAMLTNAMETQMVRALGVKIGGGNQASQPMETVRQSLVHKRDDLPAQEPGEPITSPQQANDAGSGSGCPFSEIVSDAFEAKDSSEADLVWTAPAQERLQRIPIFVRGMVKKSIEQYAREKGCHEIDVAMMEELKGNYGF